MLPRQAFLARLAASESDADVQAAVADMRALVAVPNGRPFALLSGDPGHASCLCA